MLIYSSPVIVSNYFATCHIDDRKYIEYNSTRSHSVRCHSARCHSVRCHSPKWHSANCLSNICHHPVCHLSVILLNVILLKFIQMNVFLISVILPNADCLLSFYCYFGNHHSPFIILKTFHFKYHFVLCHSVIMLQTIILLSILRLRVILQSVIALCVILKTSIVLNVICWHLPKWLSEESHNFKNISIEYHSVVIV
jgi:hypothetical protein